MVRSSRRVFWSLLADGMAALNATLLKIESKYNSWVIKPKPSKALVPDKAHSEAVRRVRKRAPPSPSRTRPCYELASLAIHSEYQGHGIGSLLVRWGLEKAEEEGVPVFAVGEAQGVDFYDKAMGFQRLWESEYWLDKEGRDISREEIQGGNEAWKKANGGLSGAEMVWCPKGYVLEAGGRTYKG